MGVNIVRCRLVAIAVVLLVLAIGRVVPADSGKRRAVVDPEREAKRAAGAWFKALVSGDVDRVMGLSAVPFSWDRKNLLASRDTLKAAYQQVVANKGARDLKPTEISLVDDKEIVAKHYLGKEKGVVTVMIRIEDEGVAVFVRPGKLFKVVGFSD